MNEPEVTAVVVTWNAKNYVKKCLDSLRRQSMSDRMQIVVVDNASTDGFQDWVRDAYRDAFHIQNTRNLGFAKANNLGISRAIGRYVCLINSDVELIDQEVIRTLWQTAEEHGCYGILGPRIVHMHVPLQPSVFSFPTPLSQFLNAVGLHGVAQFLSDIWRNRSSDGNVCTVDAVSGCFLFARRDVIRSVGCLDEEFFFYGEDIDLCKRVREAGWHVGFVSGVEVVHYGGASSDRAPLRFFVGLIDSKIKLWRKHWRRVFWLFRALLVLYLSLRCAAYGALLLCAVSAQHKARRYIRGLQYLVGKAEVK